MVVDSALEASPTSNQPRVSLAEPSILSASALKSKLVLDTRNYFISKIIPGLMGLLTVMVFVRLVGYEQYGRYAVLVALVTACATAAAGWLNQGILRFHSQHQGTDEEQSFRRASYLGVLISALLGSAIVFLIIWRGSIHSRFAAAAALMLFVPMLVYMVELTVLQASLRSSSVVGRESLRAAVCFAIPATLVLVTRNRNYLVLLVGVGIGYLLPLAIKRTSGDRKKDSAIVGKVERYALNRIWNYGWPVGLWLGCQSCLVVSDRYFVQRFWGYAQAGVYASVYDVIVRSFSLAFAPITLSVHSVLMHRWNQGDRRTTMSVLRKAMGCELLLFLPVPVALLFSNGVVARIILGKANLEAARALLPLAIGGFLWQLALLAHKPLELLCRTRRMLAGMGAALALNVVGNFFLVPRFGFLASACLSAASSALYLLLLLALVPVREFSAASMRTAPDNLVQVEEQAV